MDRIDRGRQNSGLLSFVNSVTPLGQIDRPLTRMSGQNYNSLRKWPMVGSKLLQPNSFHLHSFFEGFNNADA
jgi:hypothetical protein